MGRVMSLVCLLALGTWGCSAARTADTETALASTGGEMNKQISVVFFDLGDTLVTGNTPRKTWVAGAKSVLERLRDKEVRIGVISNTADMDRTELLKILPADFGFDLFEDALVVLSSEVQVSKPDPEIFLEAVRRAGVTPGEALFVGESLEETLAAQRVGMKGARVHRFPQDWDGVVDTSG
jgi:HAD superfamily hydrolase (TIGR01549 family)